MKVTQILQAAQQAPLLGPHEVSSAPCPWAQCPGWLVQWLQDYGDGVGHKQLAWWVCGQVVGPQWV